MHRARVPLFSFEDLRALALCPQDAPSLQVLLEKSADYIQLATGAPLGPEASESLMLDRPEGFDLTSKILLGLFDPSGEMAGVVDIVRGYPTKGDWWLGLLLLTPDRRGRGLGQRAYEEFALWAGRQGAKRVYLGVLEQNARAARFWSKVGFEELDRRPARQADLSGSTVIVMRSEVDAASQDSSSRPTTR